MVYPVDDESERHLSSARRSSSGVIGGLGSVPGALAGGIVLGVRRELRRAVLRPEHALTVGFLMMLSSIDGEAHRAHGHQGLRMKPRWLAICRVRGLVLVLATTPLWASNYIVRVAIMIAMFTNAHIVVEFHRRDSQAIRRFRRLPSSALVATPGRWRSAAACRWCWRGSSRPSWSVHSPRPSAPWISQAARPLFRDRLDRRSSKWPVSSYRPGQRDRGRGRVEFAAPQRRPNAVARFSWR